MDFLRPPRFQWIAENVAGAFVSWRQGLEKPMKKSHHWRYGRDDPLEMPQSWLMVDVSCWVRKAHLFCNIWLRTYVSSCFLSGFFGAKDIKNVEGLGALAIIGKFHFDRWLDRYFWEPVMHDPVQPVQDVATWQGQSQRPWTTRKSPSSLLASSSTFHALHILHVPYPAPGPNTFVLCDMSWDPCRSVISSPIFWPREAKTSRFFVRMSLIEACPLHCVMDLC